MPAASPPPETFEVDNAGHRLRADAAASYLRMLADELPAGGVDVFMRSLEVQARLYKRYTENRGPVAARPSPTAPHVRGIAMDLHTTANKRYNPSPAHTWLSTGGDGSAPPVRGEKLRAHAYGWSRTVPTERWHYGYNPASDQKRAADLAARLDQLGFRDVRAFQRDRGLKDDGADGPFTWAALLAASGQKPPDGWPAIPAVGTRLVTRLSSVSGPTPARIAAFNCAGFRKASLPDRQIDALVGTLLTMAGSINTLTECPEWLRNHIRGACACTPGTHRTMGDADRWRVAIRGSQYDQAILFDSMKWSYLGATGGEFGPTDYHGYLIAGLQQTTTKATLTVGCYHLPPNSVSKASFQKNALLRLIDQMPARGHRLLGGDGADESGWVPGWDDARRLARTSSNRNAFTYQRSIRDRIHSRELQVRKYTVVPSQGASDHDGVLAQITIPASTS